MIAVKQCTSNPHVAFILTRRQASNMHVIVLDMETIRCQYTIEREEVTSQQDGGRVLKHGRLRCALFRLPWQYIHANQLLATHSISCSNDAITCMFPFP